MRVTSDAARNLICRAHQHLTRVIIIIDTACIRCTVCTAQSSVMDLWSRRRSLPIFPARRRLLKELQACMSCVVMGETGSGKTTQLPQYLLESGVCGGRAIAVTQPRRVAATSVARRVAQERGSALGQEVGYAVRFDECCSDETRIKFMTDGMLLREAMTDPLLKRYGIIILDEAHERTIHTEILFGVVKSAQMKREGHRLSGRLKVIVMSATLAADEFSRYFHNAKVLYIQGRQFPVEVFYTAQPQPDYVHASVSTVLQLHQQHSSGDILVFLTGREEIESMQNLLLHCRALFPPDWMDILVCPFFAALPSKQQQEVFKTTPKGCRKIILSTNIAETSITLPGVCHVVDTGVVKSRGYNPLIGLDILCVQPVSKAQARQRAGRAGREAPGNCYRLYTEDTFSELCENTEPEILRCPLNTVVLELLAMGIQDLLTFDFMSAPSEDSLVAALEELCHLGAVEEAAGGGGGGGGGGVRLTQLGKRMAHFPLEPALAKAILAAPDYGCSEEVVAIVSLLSVDSVLFTPLTQRDRATTAHQKFISPDGDHMTLLTIFQAYQAAQGNKKWCRDNFIHQRNMRTAVDVYRQLVGLCERHGVELGASRDSLMIRKALLAGLFRCTAQHTGEGKYRALSSRQEIHLHPSSCLFHTRPHPQWVMYSQLVHTTKCYMRNVSVVEADWGLS